MSTRTRPFLADVLNCRKICLDTNRGKLETVGRREQHPPPNSIVMAIQFNCVQCDRRIETPDETVGKKCRCPDCGQIMPIPGEVTSRLQPQAGPAEASPPPGEFSNNPYATSYSPASARPPGPLPPASADRSTIVLTLGIISMLAGLMSCGCCIVFPVCLGTGIPAWVMGHRDLREIKQGRRHPSQRSTLQAGMTCGIIGVCLVSAMFVLRFGFIFLQAGFLD